MKELRYLNKYLYKYRKLLILGLLWIIISNVFQILPAQMVRHSIDLVVDNIRIYRSFDNSTSQQNFFNVFAKGILIYALLILVMALLRGFFLYLVRQTLIVMSRHIEYDLKNEIFEHYQALPLSFYRKNNTGDIMNRISEDVGRVRMYLGPSIMYGLTLFTLFFMLIPIMFSISVKLTIYALLPLPILSLSIFYVNSIVEHRSEMIQKSQSRSNRLHVNMNRLRILVKKATNTEGSRSS
jgi:ATP-binding cassette, subfamily B, multidrug efflux pump